MDTVALSDEAQAVPQLIIVNGNDTHVGTARPYAYFEQYRMRGAPLTFLIQNQTPHCCVANIVPLMLAWLADVIQLRRPVPSGPLRPVDQRRGWVGILQVVEGVVEELWHAKTWNIMAAEIERKAVRQAAFPNPGLEIPRAPKDAQVPSSGRLVDTWLPSRSFAQEWLIFARQKAHPITPLE
jgi:hypothetical protein